MNELCTCDAPEALPIAQKEKKFRIPQHSERNGVRLWHTPKMSLANIEKLDSGAGGESAAERRRRYLNSTSQDNNISFRLHSPRLWFSLEIQFSSHTSSSTFGFISVRCLVSRVRSQRIYVWILSMSFLRFAFMWRLVRTFSYSVVAGAASLTVIAPHSYEMHK